MTNTQMVIIFISSLISLIIFGGIIYYTVKAALTRLEKLNIMAVKLLIKIAEKHGVSGEDIGDIIVEDYDTFRKKYEYEK